MRGGGGERREKKIASDERNSIRETFFYETAKTRASKRVNERERERASIESERSKECLTLSVYTRFPSSFR
jgi:hypothetical protein